MKPHCLAASVLVAAFLATSSAGPRAAETQANLGSTKAPVAAAKAKPDKPLTELPYTPSLDIPSMDRSADPCVDFYRFTCGGWQKNNPIPPDQSSWSVYGKLYDENTRFLWGILDETATKTDRSANEQKIGDYFAACMDETAADHAGTKPLKPALDEIAALPSKIALVRFLARQQMETPGGMLFGFGSSQDFDDATQVIAFAVSGGLGLLDRDYYVKDDDKSKDIRKKYVAHIAKVLGLLGDKSAQAASAARQVMEIETALAKATLTRVDRRDPYKLKHRMKREELQAMTPNFNWDAFLEAAALPKYDLINVTEPAFYQEVDKQIRSRDLAAWKNYLRWHLARTRSPYLSKAFVQADFDFYRKYLRGVSEMQPRWKRCVQWVDRDLGEALGQVFVAKTFGPDTKKRALDMTLQVEKAMEEDVRQLPWMGEETKAQALAKLHKMANKIGYPDKWRDYSPVTIARGDLIGNVNRATVFESRRQMDKIGKPLDRGEWQMTPPTVNAYYDAQMNDMNFPAGVLQPPLFDPKMDDAPNYGNTGATIGHELTHGFDDEGRKFDADGNLRDWWTPKDSEEFERRAACVSDQYGKYIAIDDIHINSKLTLGEDAADLGGTILAYNAWKNAIRGQDLKASDGFAPDQRFFIGMAQWACSNKTPEEARIRAVTDPHSPERYRINGVVANMPEFSAAFQCKAGQPMVNEPVCRVW